VIAVVGRSEAESRQVALRRFGGQAQEILGLDEAVSLILKQATPPDLIGAQ
jgi:threonyl-tRNA synthetase